MHDLDTPCQKHPQNDRDNKIHKDIHWVGMKPPIDGD